MRAADGSRHWFEASGQPIQHGSEQAEVVVIRDITEWSLRRLQEAFVAKAEHELRTPLTVLCSALELRQRSLTPGANGERRQRYLALALLQTRRLSLLINDLVDLARIQHGGLQLAREWWRRRSKRGSCWGKAPGWC